MVASEQIVFQITMAAIELLAQIMTPLGGRPRKQMPSVPPVALWVAIFSR
jgi:hypothetical protein